MKINDDNLVRTILRSEVTWIVLIVGVIWGFINSVVLPLQKLQIQVTQIQEQLISEKARYVSIEQTITNLVGTTEVLKSRLETHLQSK